MPTTTTTTRRTTRAKRRPRKSNIYATKAKFIPKSLAQKRYGQVSTKTFYFKTAGTIDSNNAGVTSFTWDTQSPPAATAPANSPNRMPAVSDAYTFAECYNEYKVLAVKVKLFAANVGTETGTISQTNTTPPIPRQAGYNRGNSVMYLDQDVRPGENLPTDIVNVMTLGSAKMIPSRTAMYTKMLYRKKGVPEWGCCDRNVDEIDRKPDPWFGRIILLGNNARTPTGVSPLWFYTVTYKIIFRGRSYKTD